MRSRRSLVFSITLVLLVGELTAPAVLAGWPPQLPFGPSKSTPQTPGGGKILSQGFGCALMGGAAALVAKAFAVRDGMRLKLPPAEIKKRETGYMVGFGLLGCAGGAAVAGSVYDKMSEQGKKNRMDALRQAADSGRAQSYTDPQTPDKTGTVTPGQRVVDANRECVDTEDVWADGGPAFTKMCRAPGSTTWEPQVT